VRIATWNVNSLKARMDALEKWLERADPDVLLMQETKLADEDAPAMWFEAAGYELASLPGPAVTGEALAGFVSVYTETMRVVDAAEHYYFDADYFRALLASPLSWLMTVTGPEGDCAAAGLLVRSDGFLHYYLSGTADDHRRRAPSKNLIVAATEFAESMGLPLNLGGGVKPGDGLEEFKRGFANCELPFRTHELICDSRAYGELAAGRKDDGFFPLYRK